MTGYYRTAEPVGACSCHTCVCPGCGWCDPTDDYDPEDTE